MHYPRRIPVLNPHGTQGVSRLHVQETYGEKGAWLSLLLTESPRLLERKDLILNSIFFFCKTITPSFELAVYVLSVVLTMAYSALPILQLMVILNTFNSIPRIGGKAIV